MNSQVVPFLRPSRGSDWSPDELAQLYRIENGLVQARLVIDVDRGITDEGDPWFVFCRGDGEVLVHITRINGEYVLHSPVMPHPLVGRSFSSLAKSFVSQVPFYLPVPANQGAQLFVHPASMLAVLIGTIFFVAQDMRFFSAPGADAAAAADETAAKGGREGDTVPSFPATFQSYIDYFLASLRDWNATQKSAYLTLMSTVAAFVVGSTIVVDHDHAEIDADAELASAGDAASWYAVAVASLPDDIAVPNRPGEWTQANLGDQLRNEATAPSAVAEEHGVVTTHFAVTATTQLDDEIAFKAAAEGASARGALGAAEADWAVHPTAAEPVVETAGPTTVARSDAIVKIASQAPQSSSVGETSAAVAPTAVEPVHGDAGFSGDAFAAFIHAVRFDFPLVVLASSNQDLGQIIDPANAEGLSSIIASALPLSSEIGFAVSGLAPVSASGAAVASHNAPLFDDAAATVVNAFLHANPGSELIFDSHGSVIIYDGHRELDGVQQLTIQVWESETGQAIAIVGHADHGPLA